MVLDDLDILYQKAVSGIRDFFDRVDDSRKSAKNSIEEHLRDMKNINKSIAYSIKDDIVEEIKTIKNDPQRYLQSAWQNGAIWFFLGGGFVSPFSTALATACVAAGFASPIVMDTIQRTMVKNYGEYKDVKQLLSEELEITYDYRFKEKVGLGLRDVIKEELSDFGKNIYDTCYKKLHGSTDNPKVDELADRYASYITEAVLNKMVDTISSNISDAVKTAYSADIATSIALSWTISNELYTTHLLNRRAIYEEISRDTMRNSNIKTDNAVSDEIKILFDEFISEVQGKSVSADEDYKVNPKKLEALKYKISRMAAKETKRLLRREGIYDRLVDVLYSGGIRDITYTVVSNILDQYSLIYVITDASPASNDLERIHNYILCHAGFAPPEKNTGISEKYAEKLVINEYDEIREKDANAYKTVINIKYGSSGFYDLAKSITKASRDYSRVIDEITEDGVILPYEWTKFDFCGTKDKESDIDYHRFMSDIASYSIVSLSNQSSPASIESGKKARNLIYNALRFAYTTAQLKLDGYVDDKEKIEMWKSDYESLVESIKELGYE